jgi:hypothetical protein
MPGTGKRLTAAAVTHAVPAHPSGALLARARLSQYGPGATGPGMRRGGDFAVSPAIARA